MVGEADQVRWRGVRPVQGISGIWPSRNAERVNKEKEVIGSATQTIYTVPATKKFYLSSLTLNSALSADATARNTVYVVTDGHVLAYYVDRQVYFVAGHLASFETFIPALEMPAGYYVVVSGDHANILSWALIKGWLEDA